MEFCRVDNQKDPARSLEFELLTIQVQISFWDCELLRALQNLFDQSNWPLKNLEVHRRHELRSMFDFALKLDSLSSELVNSNKLEIASLDFDFEFAVFEKS